MKTALKIAALVLIAPAAAMVLLGVAIVAKPNGRRGLFNRM